MTQHKGKKLVYISEDLLDEVAKISRSRGETISRFIEEALRQAVRVSKAGYHLEKLAEFFEVMQAQKVLGGAFVPMEVLNYLTSKTYREERDQLNVKWYESGKWYGKYLKERFDDPIQAFKVFLEASRWDLNEVEVRREGGKVRVRCISTVLTAEATELLAKFIEGAMHSLGYKTERNEYVKGIIILELSEDF
jgi:hypothetical protein